MIDITNQLPRSVDIDGFGFGVQMLKRSGLNSSSRDKRVDFVLLQSDHSPEFVCGNRTLINELVERAQRDAKTRRGIPGAQPSDLGLAHVHTLPPDYWRSITGFQSIPTHSTSYSSETRETLR
jgi:hypothetical protein